MKMLTACSGCSRAIFLQPVRDCKQSTTSDGCWKLELARCSKTEVNSSKSCWLTEFGHGRHSCQRSPPWTMPTGRGRTKLTTSVYQSKLLANNFTYDMTIYFMHDAGTCSCCHCEVPNVSAVGSPPSTRRIDDALDQENPKVALGQLILVPRQSGELSGA